MSKVLTATLLVGGASLATLTALAVRDPTTVGTAPSLALAATVVVPFASSLLNAAFGSQPPRYVRDSLLPAAVFYACILGASLASSGAGLNWLVFTILYLVAVGAGGYVAGKVVRAAVLARRR